MITNKMTAHAQGLGYALLRLIAYSFIVYLTAELLKWSATVELPEQKFNEASMVELLQTILLATCSLLYLFSAYKYRQFLPLSVALFAFCFASMIREQDALLDEHVFDGAWQLIAFGTIIIAVVVCVVRRSLLLANLNQFVPKFAFGILLSGVISTYVFARLYGRQIFWRAVMEERYFRDVKNVSEESMELFGYVIILIGSVEFAIMAKSQQRKIQLQNAEENYQRVSA